MKSSFVAIGLLVLLFVALTQIGWISNGFYGFTLLLPEQITEAVFFGVLAGLLLLFMRKITR